MLAIGAVYAYSFPGLVWLLVALGAWVAVELGRALARRSLGGFAVTVREAAPSAALAVALLAVGIAPEAGRMVDFAGFETFDPDGPGLGNLFNRLSPLEALGIWPSGDFRVEPGDGAVPALVFYLGAAVAIAALCFGLIWWWRRGERAVPAALGGAAALWLYSLLDGTPYQEAKALVLAAPLVATVAVRALLEEAPSVAEARTILRRRSPALLLPGRARAAKLQLAIGALAAVFAVAAAGSSVLALANGPVGPTAYSPAARGAPQPAARRVDLRLRAGRRARRPARARLPGLGAARGQDLHRSLRALGARPRAPASRPRSRSSSATARSSSPRSTGRRVRAARGPASRFQAAPEPIRAPAIR